MINRRGFLANVGALFTGFTLGRLRAPVEEVAPPKLQSTKLEWIVPLEEKGQYLVGYKGNSYLESGYFYAPYVPIVQTPTVIDPDSFNINKGCLKKINSSYIYGIDKGQS